jgi:hypothetical protein
MTLSSSPASTKRKKAQAPLLAMIDVSKYPGDVEVPWFQGRIKCGKCGRRGRWVDVRPNWKEAPGMPQDWTGRPVGEK